MSIDNGPSEELQRILLARIISEKGFLSSIAGWVGQETFTGRTEQDLYLLVSQYQKQYGEIPSKSVLIDLVERHDRLTLSQDQLSTLLSAHCDYSTDRLCEWIKERKLQLALADFGGSQDYEKLAQSVSSISSLSLKQDEGSDSVLLDEKLEGQESLELPCIPTPWEWLNDQLRGGPRKGDLCVILSVISGGKTTGLVNLAVHATELGFFVLYLTFEDGVKKIRRRMLQRLANMTREELVERHERATKKAKRIRKSKGGLCVTRNLTTRRSSVGDLHKIIRDEQSRHSRRVDLVCTDYMDRFKPASKHDAYRHDLQQIMEDCKVVATKEEVVHWTARQVQRTMVGKPVVGLNAAGESWGTMESPDLVISFGEEARFQDLDQRKLTLFTAKVRDGVAHKKATLMADFARQRIYEPED